jgi:glycosyltransferase involved in cell wall biosynthesis
MKFNGKNSIIFLLPRFSGGGAERVSINLLNELYGRGYSVSIIVFEKSGPLLSLIPDDLIIYDLETTTLKRSIIPLVKKIQQLNPKVIFSTLGYINVALLIVRWLLPREIKIWTREANMPSISLSNNSNPILMTILYRLLYKKTDKLICTSVKMKDEFASDFLVPDEIIEILHNPVDVDLIRTSSIPVRRFDRGGVCYIAAGRLTFQKGFDRLLCWFSELENKRSTLVILGDGDLKNFLIDKVEMLDIKESVIFLGFCNNPWQWYAGADVFLLPSRWEGMPNSVLESLACGTPVIATKNSGGIEEIVGKGINKSINIVTEWGGFIKAMNEASIKCEGCEFKSLLPEKYEKENVVAIFEKWLNSLK